jgi:hypothetical protein
MSSASGGLIVFCWHLELLLFLQFIEGQFKEESSHTIGVEFGSKVSPAHVRSDP